MSIGWGVRDIRTGAGAQNAPAAGDALRRAADALVRLVREHLALARVELRHDLRIAAKDVAFALAGVPILLTGWALLMVAFALGLAPLTGGAVAFAIVGLLNLAAGAGVSAVFVRRLMREDKPGMGDTSRVLEEDRRWLQGLARSRASNEAAIQ